MTGPACILVVGGQPLPGSALVRALAADRAFRVSNMATARAAITPVGERRLSWSAVIVDAPLPDCEVPEFCALLRRGGLRIPILVLADTAAESEVVSALDAGAINYLRRPVGIRELTARLRSNIRRNQASGHAWLAVGPYWFQPAVRLLRDPVADLQMRLTTKESDILACLYHAEGVPVSRETLLHKVWDYAPGANTHTVETHVYRLRRKIEPHGGSIILRNHDGYRLAASPAAADRAAWLARVREQGAA
jgi:DNA-binding response OmpR family regulator